MTQSVTTESFLSILKRIILSLFATSEVEDTSIEVVDKNIYLLPVEKRWGKGGFGYYNSGRPIRIDNKKHSFTTEDLAVVLGNKYRAPITVMGTREELMQRVKGLDGRSFNNAKTFAYYREEVLRNHIRDMVSEMPNPVAVFNNWLLVQVNNGLITKIDGLQLKSFDIPDHLATLMGRIDPCPMSEFLERYFLSYTKYHQAVGVTCYSNIEVFSRELIYQYNAFSMGVSDHQYVQDIFKSYTEMLWQHESKKLKTELVTADQL